MSFDINTYLKPEKNLVIELPDEAEYLVDEQAVIDMQNNEEEIALKRLIDGKLIPVKIEDIIKSLESTGPVDYI